MVGVGDQGAGGMVTRSSLETRCSYNKVSVTEVAAIKSEN